MHKTATGEKRKALKTEALELERFKYRTEGS
jgi:hypothetical protein